MYETAEVLQKIDDNVAIVVLLMLFPWTGGFVQIFEALRLGFRDHVAGQPIGMTMTLMAHDVTYFVSVDHYFNDVDHVFFELFWVGMIPSVAVELVLMYHWLKFRDPGFGGGLSTRAVVGMLVVLQAVAFGLFWWLQSIVDDPLNLVGFTVVQVAAVVFLVPWVLARGNSRGQSRAFAWATLLGPASLGFLFIPYFSPEFANHWEFWFVVGAMTACAALYLVLFERFRRIDAEAADMPAPAAMVTG